MCRIGAWKFGDILENFGLNYGTQITEFGNLSTVFFSYFYPVITLLLVIITQSSEMEGYNDKFNMDYPVIYLDLVLATHSPL